MPLKLVKRKGSENWYIRGTVAGVGIFESAGTTDRGQAEAFRIKLEGDTYRRGKLGERPAATFADAVNAYLDGGGSDRFVLRLLDYFKERPLSEIGQAEIDRCANVLHPGTKAATRVRCVYTPLNAILKKAYKAKLPGASLPTIDKPSVASVPLRRATPAQVEAILPYCNPRLKAFVLVATCTGLRASEVLRLTAPDFAIREGWVQVDQTKTGDEAFVPLWPEALEAVRAVGRENGSAVGYRTPQGVNKALKVAAVKAGVDVKLASTHRVGRHCFSGRLFDAGADIATVQEAGRWKKISTVKDRYGHLQMKAVHDLMMKVGRK